MDEISIELNRILPNPWQTRQAGEADPDHVTNLAEDIRAHGLLQTPLGRLVDAAGTPRQLPALLPDEVMVALRDNQDLRVQLAFGHNRWAAFQLLAQKDAERWGTMPVRLTRLDDQAMALAAWSENSARKDLSPLEAAQALQRLITDFEWTQEQAAKQTGLSRSAVANKLRLLRLPSEQQKQLHEGSLSERQAMALLPLYDLPVAAQDFLERRRAGNDYQVRRLVQALEHPEKISSTDLRQAVHDALDSISLPLATDEKNYSRAHFPLDRELPNVSAPLCTECPHCLRGKRCADPACCDQKEEAFELAELAAAVAATGIPRLTYQESNRLRGYNAKVYFYPDEEGRSGLQRALDRKCPHLRLTYESSRESSYRALSVPDYPMAVYACVPDQPGSCPCRDADRDQRRAQKEALENKRKKEAEALREATVKELVAALRVQEVGAWRAVLWALRSYSCLNNGHADKVVHMDGNTTLENIARAVLKTAFDWTSLYQDATTSLTAWREKVGWLPTAPEDLPAIELPAGEAVALQECVE